MRTFRLKTPLTEEEVRRFRVKDTIYLSGRIFTMRDQAHRRSLQYLRDGKSLPFWSEGLPMYHCGPIVQRTENGDWEVIAAGPTTSGRMEAYEREIIEKLGIRMIVGKGGMGDETAAALKRCGAVYAAFVGGAAVLAAKHIRGVEDVFWLDLGMPEAVWIFRVEDLGPLTITMDTHGDNLYKEVMSEAERRRKLQLL